MKVDSVPTFNLPDTSMADGVEVESCHPQIVCCCKWRYRKATIAGTVRVWWPSDTGGSQAQGPICPEGRRWGVEPPSSLIDPFSSFVWLTYRGVVKTPQLLLLYQYYYCIMYIFKQLMSNSKLLQQYIGLLALRTAWYL